MANLKAEKLGQAVLIMAKEGDCISRTLLAREEKVVLINEKEVFMPLLDYYDPLV